MSRREALTDEQLRARDIDLRPRMMPERTPLWHLHLYTDRTYDPIYVKVGTGSLVIHVADLLDPSADEVTLQLNMTPGVRNGRVQLYPTDATTLGVTCRKKLSHLMEYVLVELPEGGCLVWEFEQARELARRRFVYLESQDEVLPGTDS